MSESIKDFLQPLSLWIYEDTIITGMDNFLLLAIVSGLLGITAFFYKYFCHKNNLPVPWFIKILGFLFSNRGGSHTGGGGDGGGGGE